MCFWKVEHTQNGKTDKRRQEHFNLSFQQQEQQRALFTRS